MVHILQVDSEEEEEPDLSLSDRDSTAETHDSMHHGGTGSMTGAGFGPEVCGKQPRADLLLHFPALAHNFMRCMSERSSSIVTAC